ncbi:MAG: hypothetical protein ACLFN8_01175 [Candidatus Woesearchaeota archaeon]
MKTFKQDIKKIILQDIDNVSYPFKEQHTKFLVEEKLIEEELAQKYLESDKAYLIDYLMDAAKKGECTKTTTKNLREKYEEHAKKIKEMLKIKKLYREHETEEDLEIEAYFFATFEDFFSSKHYQEGIVKEIHELNKDIKNENPEIHIIGITARAAHIKTQPEKYQYLTQLTHNWNIKNEAGLKKIFFENKKINAYNEIKNMQEYKNKEIICFLEDDPRNVEDFLKEKIPCVLIHFSYHNHELLVERLKKEYTNYLHIAKTPNDAKLIIKKLIQKQ